MDRPSEASAPTLFYRIVMHVSAALFLVLALLLFFSPRTFLDGLGLDMTASTDFLARRASVLLLSLSVLCFFGRSAKSGARQALALAMLAATGLMAILGTAELIRGATTIAILKPVAIEATCAVCFFVIWWRDRRGAPTPRSRVDIN
jgi:hypothetical protein